MLILYVKDGQQLINLLFRNQHLTSWSTIDQQLTKVLLSDDNVDQQLINMLNFWDEVDQQLINKLNYGGKKLINSCVKVEQHVVSNV